MRAHGVSNFPDPASNGRAPTSDHVNKRSPAFRTAAQACHPLMIAMAAIKPKTSHARDIREAECMRTHGVPNFPDPLPGGGYDYPGVDEPELPGIPARIERVPDAQVTRPCAASRSSASARHPSRQAAPVSDPGAGLIGGTDGCPNPVSRSIRALLRFRKEHFGRDADFPGLRGLRKRRVPDDFCGWTFAQGVVGPLLIFRDALAAK